MYKIRKIKFRDHPILHDLDLDFCAPDGKAVETVIFAGENGTGKSAILNFMYGLFSGSVLSEAEVELENQNTVMTLHFAYDKERKRIWVRDSNGMNALPGHNDFREKYPVSGIYSDVDINFRAQSVSTVTSLNLDESRDSRRSSTELPKQIKQLLIDVQALDDAELAREMRSAPNMTKAQLTVSERMPRFTKAFAHMFNGLTYDRVENENGHKEIYFRKYGIDIPIDNLSSGEKQVVYRGCFLLKDVNATNGAFVFIDEPEISLHPSWQIKIMDYYKGIFSDESGNQTSQIFAVTHSPFVIHNNNRRNDKVIVLARDKEGNVVVKDKPEYYKCDSIKAVEDAFEIHDFSADKSTVYLEGRTDEKYFNKALDVFELKVPFQFKWVGYIDEKGQEANTGDKSVDAAFRFLVAKDLPIKNFCLKDCDTKRETTKKGNAFALSIPTYENSKGMKKGIENALILDSIDLSPYYSIKEKEGDYGGTNTISEFDKMACCDAICSMNTDILKEVLVHLKETIDYIRSLYSEGEANDTQNQTPN